MIKMARLSYIQNNITLKQIVQIREVMFCFSYIQNNITLKPPHLSKKRTCTARIIYNLAISGYLFVLGHNLFVAFGLPFIYLYISYIYFLSIIFLLLVYLVITYISYYNLYFLLFEFLVFLFEFFVSVFCCLLFNNNNLIFTF